ncbi:manganese-dependent inorganic pyrophosphatase [Patescibacteria group bacterium]|nr:manganese-dependent inorganic pyrophosphatase [Patescibacteria group bacterium]
MIYVIGHKSPDTDTVVSAVAYAHLMGEDYQPLVAGDLNLESAFVLEKFDIDIPKKLASVSKENKFFLVDHNEKSQRLNGITEENIVGILDHHKMDFCNYCPIDIIIKPCGSSCTIIAEMFFDKGIKLDKNMAGALLAGILSDTVIFKSPTCIDLDINIANKLADIAGISDINAFGMELFSKKSEIQNKTDEEIINNDFKEFDIKDKKIGVGQVELADASLVMARKENILKKQKEILERDNYFAIILMVTDIIKEGSYLWIVGDNLIFDVFENDMQSTKFYEGLMSRKKQILPKLSNI